MGGAADGADDGGCDGTLSGGTPAGAAGSYPKGAPGPAGGMAGAGPGPDGARVSIITQPSNPFGLSVSIIDPWAPLHSYTVAVAR
jgi:hypothetical protein